MPTSSSPHLLLSLPSRFHPRHLLPSTHRHTGGTPRRAAPSPTCVARHRCRLFKLVIFNYLCLSTQLSISKLQKQSLFSNYCPLYFVATKRFFSKMGLACHIAKIHSEASVEHDAWVLKQYIKELYWGSVKLVMLLGHSKGGVDAAAALSKYWSDLRNKVAGLAMVQSPYGGTPIASDILRQGQVADKETRRVMEL